MPEPSVFRLSRRVLGAANRGGIQVYLDFTPDFDDMNRRINRLPPRNDDVTELPPKYVILPVKDSSEYPIMVLLLVFGTLLIGRGMNILAA